jgi:hypothetical protein
MEFCSKCQEIKPYRVEGSIKVCRDCGYAMGKFLGIDDLKKLIEDLEKKIKNGKEEK